MKTLRDTVNLMISDNYKDRFLAEYIQNKVRYIKLREMVNNWNQLDFVPTCPKEVYDQQLSIMSQYIDILELRAKAEGIDLPSV